MNNNNLFSGEIKIVKIGLNECLVSTFVVIIVCMEVKNKWTLFPPPSPPSSSYSQLSTSNGPRVRGIAAGVSPCDSIDRST